jgi:ParB-like chromosome segregation protein Spo0J
MMKLQISSIKVAERIRKFTQRVDELAADIKKNGLINQITVMSVNDGDKSLAGGEYQLLAGLRRLKAAQLMGWTEIEVTVVSPQDAEAQLNIEYSENVQREAFTFSEKMDYTRLIAEIEKAKAQERMLAGKKASDPTDPGPQGSAKRETRDILGEKIGMSGRQYDRAKFVAEHAPSEIIDELDRKERSVRKTYDEIRAVNKPSAPNYTLKSEGFSEKPVSPSYTVKAAPPVQSTPAQQSLKLKAPAPSPLPNTEDDRIRKLREFDALSPEGKIAELQKQLKSERYRAATAESELQRLKEIHHNDVLHRDGSIKNLELRLEAATDRIRELEAKYEAD